MRCWRRRCARPWPRWPKPAPWPSSAGATVPTSARWSVCPGWSMPAATASTSPTAQGSVAGSHERDQYLPLLAEVEAELHAALDGIAGRADRAQEILDRGALPQRRRRRPGRARGGGAPARCSAARRCATCRARRCTTCSRASTGTRARRCGTCCVRSIWTGPRCCRSTSATTSPTRTPSPRCPAAASASSCATSRGRTTGARWRWTTPPTCTSCLAAVLDTAAAGGSA